MTLPVIAKAGRHERAPCRRRIDGTCRARAASRSTTSAARSSSPPTACRSPAVSNGWTPSPGGLVRALLPLLRTTGGTWVGWTGVPDDAPAPFEH